MQILSYPVGLVVGLIRVTVAFSSGEASGHLLLDGKRVCDLAPTRNHCEVDLGPEPRVHRLELATQTPQGFAIQDTRWLNRGVLPAELRVVKLARGKRCELLFAYAHPHKEKAIGIRVDSDRGVLFEGQPRESFTVDCEGLSFLVAEATFADGLRASSVVSFSQFSESATSQVFPWHIEAIAAKETVPPDVTGLPVVAVERGGAHLVVVAEPFALNNLVTLAGTDEPPAGDWAVRGRTTPLRVLRQRELAGPLREALSTTLILAVDGFPRLELPRSREWLELLLRACEELSQRFANRPRRFWDAIALGGYLASGMGTRRAVWAVRESPGEDASRFSSSSAQTYLHEVNVPLMYWVIGARGGGDTMATPVTRREEIPSAFAALGGLLARQVVLWVQRDPLVEPPLSLPPGYQRAGFSAVPQRGQLEVPSNNPPGIAALFSPMPVLSAGPNPSKSPNPQAPVALPVPPGFARRVRADASASVFWPNDEGPRPVPVNAVDAPTPVFVFFHPAFVADASLRYWKNVLGRLSSAAGFGSPLLLLPSPGGFGLQSLSLGGPGSLEDQWDKVARTFKTHKNLADRRGGYLEAFARGQAAVRGEGRAQLIASLGQEEKDVLRVALASLVQWVGQHPGPAWLVIVADDFPVDPCRLVADVVSHAAGEPGLDVPACDLREELEHLAAFLAYCGYSVVGLWQTEVKPEATSFSGHAVDGSAGASAVARVPLAGGRQEGLELLATATGGATNVDRVHWNDALGGPQLWVLVPTDGVSGASGSPARASLGSVSWSVRGERPAFWAVGPLHGLQAGPTRYGELLKEVVVEKSASHEGTPSYKITLVFDRQREEPVPARTVRLTLGTWAPMSRVYLQQKLVEMASDAVFSFQAILPADSTWLGVVVEDLASGRWGAAAVPKGR